MNKPSLKVLLFGLVKHAKTDMEKGFTRAGIELTPFQFGVLSMLKHEAFTLNQLAQRLGVRPPSLIPPLDRLVKQGYAHKEKDHKDRRKIHLKITAKGLTVFKKILQDHPTDALNKAFHKLSKSKRDRLIQALIELTENFTN